MDEDGSAGAVVESLGGSPGGDGFVPSVLGTESTGTLYVRENCKLSKNTEIQEKSGLEKRVGLD